jgi:hypothetical protein
MSSVDGRRWVVVVFGMPVLLLALVGVLYAGAYAVPGAPCAGGGELTAPPSQVIVAANDSAVFAVHTGGADLGGPTTDRVVVAVNDAESERTHSTEWIGADGSVTQGETLTLRNSDIGFTPSDRDIVTVRWYGTDPEVAGFCPNGRTFADLTVTRIENASVPIEG